MRYYEFDEKDLIQESWRLASIIKKSAFTPDLVVYPAQGGYIIGHAIADYFHSAILEIESHRSGEVKKSKASKILFRLPSTTKRILRTMECRLRFFLEDPNKSVQATTMHITGRYQLPSKAKMVLIVDDSVDTGGSLIAATEIVEECFPEAFVRTATLNVFEQSKQSISVDWHLYDNCLLCTPSSKDNKGYQAFINEYYH